ncbi:hypothetical protein AB9F29_12425 [Falsihalocynthiibacter sp. S25ZX9]|uniref:hypothetical protein n=1 Tax=unclassified Falsihalocynthiibacter TaxID=2854191 RepID=UPI00351035E9
MRVTLPAFTLLALAPFGAFAEPSMVGQWSCENYSETNQIMGTVAYYNNGTSEGSFDATIVGSDATVELIGTYRADWKQEKSLLVETMTSVDVQDLLINGQSYMDTPTETEFENAMLAEGATTSQIIDSSEVMVVLQDTDGNISSCSLF